MCVVKLVVVCVCVCVCVYVKINKSVVLLLNCIYFDDNLIALRVKSVFVIFPFLLSMFSAFWHLSLS